MSERLPRVSVERPCSVRLVSIHELRDVPVLDYLVPPSEPEDVGLPEASFARLGLRDQHLRVDHDNVSIRQNTFDFEDRVRVVHVPLDLRHGAEELFHPAVGVWVVLDTVGREETQPFNLPPLHDQAEEFTDDLLSLSGNRRLRRQLARLGGFGYLNLKLPHHTPGHCPRTRSALERARRGSANDKLLFGETAGSERTAGARALEVENVFKIATTYSRVREHLTRKGWEYQGKDEEMEMDSFRNRKTGKKLFIEDISDNFPVTFLMGELSVEDFSRIASGLTPETALLEVESSWEGKPTTIVVAMTEEQVRDMFGRRTKMRKLLVSRPDRRPG